MDADRIEWRAGVPVDLPVDPDLAKDELERIRLLNRGKLVAKVVVNESTPKTAVLHPCFEWRNTVAADRYREWQARNIIKNMRVVYQSDDGIPKHHPVYVHVTGFNEEGKKESYYQNTEVAMSRPDEWMSAIRNFQLKLDALQRSMDELKSMASKSEDSERLERLTIAAMAFQTLRDALRH